MKTYFKNLKNNKAYTLIELLLVTGIVAILAIGVFVAYKMVKENQKMQETAQFMKLILERIDDASAVAEDYSNFASDLNNTSAFVTSTQTVAAPTNLIASKIIPSNYVSGGFVSSPLGEGYIGFSNLTNQANTTTVADKNLFVTIFVPNAGQCIKLTTLLQDTFSAMAMTTINAGGSQQFYGDSLVRPFNSPYNIDNVRNYCLNGVRGTYLHLGLSKAS